MASSGKDILISLPTNNCGRILMFLKLNSLQDVVDVKSPKDYGGLQSPDFLAINPQGKFPAFLSADGSFTLFEAQVILDYLADKYKDRLQSSPFSCQAASATAEQRAKCRLIIQVHDLYIASANCTQPGYFATQGCMYKAEMGIQDRCAKSLELAKQLDVLESMWDANGPYACGAEITLADLVVYPTMIFVMDLMNPSLGWDVEATMSKRPKLSKWYYTAMEKSEHSAITEVGKDVHGFCEEIFIGSKRCEQIRATFDCDEARALLGK